MWYPKLFALNMTEFLLEFDTMWAVLWSFYTYFLPLFSWGSLCFYSWYTADDLLQCFGFKFDMWTCWNMDFKSFHSYSFVVIQTCQHLQTGRKKKNPDVLLFSLPHLCPFHLLSVSLLEVKRGRTRGCGTHSYEMEARAPEERVWCMHLDFECICMWCERVCREK